MNKTPDGLRATNRYQPEGYGPMKYLAILISHVSGLGPSQVVQRGCFGCIVCEIQKSSAVRRTSRRTPLHFRSH